MAKPELSLQENAPGPFFVDSSCINCGVSRHYAPALFGDTGDHAYVMRQPRDTAETLQAGRALLACPVAAIGTHDELDLIPARNSLPLELVPSVFINGFNHRRSFGTHSYFIRSDEGNWLIDSPRYTNHLVRRFEALGGLRYIFLTHSDDVADAERYATHFNAQRIIHALEAHAQPDAELILSGESFTPIGAGEIIFTPWPHPRSLGTAVAGALFIYWRSFRLASG